MTKQSQIRLNKKKVSELFALSARDVYNAVTEKDWTGAGLAALGILPFIPSGLRQLKPTARYIPSVSRSREQDLLNAAFDNIKQKREYLSDVANERNRVLESVNDYAHRVRAEKSRSNVWNKLQ